MSLFDDSNAKPKVTDNREVIKTRDMTALDELTHNFTGDPAMRRFFIQKHGQCFEGGVRYTRIE